MKHASFKYAPPISTWAKGRRVTIQHAFQQWIKPMTMMNRYRSLEDWKYERELCNLANHKRLHRGAVGMVRAFGSPTFFRGCYVGAEND